MLRNKRIGKKIRNIVILLMAIIVMIGAYRYIDRSRAEMIIEIDAVAVDSYGYLENEEFKLEAKQLDDGLYEIELPESVNTKKFNQIVKINDGLEITENRVYLSKEQIENEKINIELEYDVVITEDRTLYSKILKYEDKENGKLVELRGYLPVDAELQVEEVQQEQLKEIFGEKKINVAYDIKILQKVVTEVPADEAYPEAEPTQIVEIIEINPEEFGETCVVTITDVSIAEKSNVYHVKEDNTYEQVNVTESTEGNVKFEAQNFSVYAVGDGEVEPDPGEDTGANYTEVKYIQPDGTWVYKFTR